MLDQSTIKGRLVAAAMRLAAERPWNEVTLAQIAVAAGVGLVDVRNHFASKGDLLASFVRMVDDAVLTQAAQRNHAGKHAEGRQAEKETPRDALFDVIMSRFDVLAPYKPGLKSIAKAWPNDPSVACAILRSQAWMLRAAGIRADGVEGSVRALGLAGVYTSVYRTWLSDDDPGLGKTMAVLDRRLRRGENALKAVDECAERFCGVARRMRDVFRRPDKDRPAENASSPATTTSPPNPAV